MVHVWHRVITGPVTRSLISVQAGCRYVPLAAGLIAGGAIPPAITPPAQSLVAHATMVAAPALPSDMASAVTGDSGSGASGESGGLPGDLGTQALPASAFLAPIAASLVPDILPPSPIQDATPGGPSPTPPFLPRRQTVLTVPQSVPEAPSLAILLSAVALLAATRRMARRGPAIGGRIV